MQTAAMFAAAICIVILTTAVVKCEEWNLLLLGSVERDVRHWPVIIDLARQRIASDRLLPAGINLKSVILALDHPIHAAST